MIFDFSEAKTHNGAVITLIFVCIPICHCFLFSDRVSFLDENLPGEIFRLYLNEIDSNLKHRVDYFKVEEENASFCSLFFSGFAFRLLQPDAKRMTNASLTLECC